MGPRARSRTIVGALAALLALAVVARPAEARGRGRGPQARSFPILDVSGSPYRIGLQHGRRFRRQIKRNVDFYLGCLAELKMTRGQALRAAGRFAPAMARHTPQLLREIDGIARGAGRTRAEILLINARTELLSLAERRTGVALSQNSAGSPGCTGVAVKRGGRLALGQNWDWRPQLDRNSVVLRIKQPGKPTVVTFTEAGMVGKIGCNSKRLGVCLNFLSHRGERRRGAPTTGVPVHVLLRRAMECRSTAEAVKTICTAPRCASVNVLLAQHTARGPVALDLETTPARVGKLKPLRGLLVHANHFKHPALNRGCDRRTDPTTLDRDRDARRRARAMGRVQDPMRVAQHVLRGRGSGTPISRTHADRKQPTDSVTVSSVVMDLSAPGLPLHITRGAPHRAPYVKHAGPLARAR